MDKGEIAQIIEFGQNPMRLFDDYHKPFKLTSRKSLLDYEKNNYQINSRRHIDHQNGDIEIIRIFSDKKNIFCSISEYDLYKLSSTNNKYRIQSKLKLHSYFPIITKERYIVDPRSIFSFSGKYLCTCRHPDKSFVIYNVSTFTRVQSVSFHLVFSKFIIERGNCNKHLLEIAHVIYR